MGGRRRNALIFALCFTSACGDSSTTGSPSGISESPEVFAPAIATYKTCEEAIADGAAPLEEGDDGYTYQLDRDGDGIACENYSNTTEFEEVGDTSLCGGDCSGHNAGFDWARDHDIEDAADCGGYSRSFIEGCEAYVENL